MFRKIVSITRKDIEEIASQLDTLPEFQEGLIYVLLFDAKTETIYELKDGLPERFPEQVFPIEVKCYGRVFYLGPLPVKPLPPNKEESLLRVFRQLSGPDSMISFAKV